MDNYNNIQNVDYLIAVLYNIYRSSKDEEKSYINDKVLSLYRSILNLSDLKTKDSIDYKFTSEEQNRIELLRRYLGNDYRDILISYPDVGAAILNEFLTPSQSNLDLATFKILSYSYNQFIVRIYANYSKTIMNNTDIVITSDDFLKYFMERKVSAKEITNNYYIAIINLDDINKSYFTSIKFNNKINKASNIEDIKLKKKNEIEKFLGEKYADKLANVPPICFQEYFEGSRNLYPYKIISINPIMKEALVVIYIKGTSIATITGINEIITDTKLHQRIVSMVGNDKYYGCFICNKENAYDIKSFQEGIIYFTNAEFNMKVDISDEK